VRAFALRDLRHALAEEEQLLRYHGFVK
jgi:hypothetical protein